MFEQAKNFVFPATSFMQAEGEEGSWGDFASGYLKQGFNSGLSFASTFSPVLSGLSGYLSLGFSPQEASGAATFELGAFAASAFAGGSGSASLLKFRLPGANSTVKALPAPTEYAKHHIFNVFRGSSSKSQKYRDFFKKHNINLDDHTIELTKWEHKQVHKAGNNWTTQWKRWIDANPNATTKKVYQQAGRMMDAHGVGHKPIVKYK